VPMAPSHVCLLGVPGGSATISQSPVAYDCWFLPVMN
jgi:hypothetical protein